MNERAAMPARGLSVYPTRPARELAKQAVLAESLGYSHLWFGDSQNIWREAYTSMAAAAMSTQRITIGTGVTNGVTRHRAVTASAWATLHELSGGRVAAGFGVGDSALHTVGLQPMKVAAFEEFLYDLRALWRGNEAKDPEGDSPYRLAYLDGPIDVPLYIAASGPKLLRLAGRVADGVILLVGTDDAAIASAMAELEQGAKEARRSLGELHVVLWTPVAIDEDPTAARDRVRAHVARTVLRPIATDLTAAEQDAVDQIRAEYDYYAHMVPGSPHSNLVTDSLVERFALAGTPDGCRSRLTELGAVGIDEVAMVPFADPNEPPEELLEQFAQL